MNASDQNRAGYMKWMAIQNYIDTNITENVLNEGLSRIGIAIQSLYDIEDPLVVRLFASELLIKRNQSGIKDFADYLGALQRLITYAEYLDIMRTHNNQEENDAGHVHIQSDDGYTISEPYIDGVRSEDNRVSRAESAKVIRKEVRVDSQEDSSVESMEITDKLSEDTLVIAYFLSRMDMEGVKVLGYKNFSAAFNELGKLIGRKPSTIKNIRDEFDPYFNNPRAGWYQRPLRKSRKIVFEKYSKVTDEELISVIKEILAGYKRIASGADNYEDRTTNDNLNNEKQHKTIKISSTVMKEIKRRKYNKNV